MKNENNYFSSYFCYFIRLRLFSTLYLASQEIESASVSRIKKQGIK